MEVRGACAEVESRHMRLRSPQVSWRFTREDINFIAKP